MKGITTIKSEKGDIIEVIGFKQGKKSWMNNTPSRNPTGLLSSSRGQNSEITGIITYLFVAMSMYIGYRKCDLA